MAVSKKKTTTGSGGLRAAKKLNLKAVLAVAAAVALVGGMSIYLSFAETGYSFVRTGSQMTGGYQGKLYQNGTRSATSPIYAFMSKKESSNTKKVCVHYTVQTPAPDNGLGFQVQILDGTKTQLTNGSFSINGRARGYSDYACILNIVPVRGSAGGSRLSIDGLVGVQMLGRGGILVDRIEGRPQ